MAEKSVLLRSTFLLQEVDILDNLLDVCLLQLGNKSDGLLVILGHQVPEQNTVVLADIFRL